LIEVSIESDPFGSGRYITSDPIGLYGGLNTYGYGNSNPGRYSDTKGKSIVVVAVAVAVVVGGAAVAVLACKSGTDVCLKKYPNGKDPLSKSRSAYLKCIAASAGIGGMGGGWTTDPVGSGVSEAGQQANK